MNYFAKTGLKTDSDSLECDANSYLRIVSEINEPVFIDGETARLLKERAKYRKDKNFIEADKNRNVLHIDKGINIIYEKGLDVQVRKGTPAYGSNGFNPFYIRTLEELEKELKNPAREKAEIKVRKYLKGKFKIGDIDSIPFLDANEPTILLSRQIPADTLETRQNKYLSQSYGIHFAVTDCSIDSFVFHPYKENHARRARFIKKNCKDDSIEVEYRTLAHPVAGEMLKTIKTVDGESLVEYHKKIFAERNKGIKVHDLSSTLLEAFKQGLDGGYHPDTVWINEKMWVNGDNNAVRTVSEKYDFCPAREKYISKSKVHEKTLGEVMELAAEGTVIPPAEFNYSIGFAMLALSPQVVQVENWDESGKMEDLAANYFSEILKETGIRPLVIKYFDPDKHEQLVRKIGRYPDYAIIGGFLDGIRINTSGYFYTDSKIILDNMYDGLFGKQTAKIPQEVIV